ncbi:UNVERIFIED_CONTAM: hypothetical protein Sindi_2149500 [Sesamum indicum]
MLLLSSTGSWITLKRRRRKRKSRKEKRRRMSHHHSNDDSSDDFADLGHKRRSRKAYSDSDLDVSASDDSRVGRGKKRSEKKSRNVAMKRTSFYSG